MNLCDSDRKAILEEAKRAGIGVVYVFGSVLLETGEPRDIDIAVKEVPGVAFFRFYAALSRRLSRPLDVIDLDQQNAVTNLILREAVRLG